MGSESEEFLIEDSDESLLDLKEINDLEFEIPEATLPSLERVLWDMESEEGSDSASLYSFQSMTARFRSMLFHCVLQGVSNQLSSASDRVRAGLPTVITNSLKYVAIGTSHGYILAFDSEQNLCWCHHDPNSSDEGAISALAFNLESTRLLVGYERGYISMLDTKNGDILRRLPDAHAPQTAVLHLRFSFLSNLALCGDSSGCVFSVSFNRRLGVRSWDSKCLFSGARGEVCVFEPLTQGHDIGFLSRHVIVAMATLSKVIVISVRPRLKVHFSQQLPRISTSLPLISWQLVSVGKVFQPVLAWGRGTSLFYTKLVAHNGQVRLIPLRNVELTYNITSLHWLGPRHLALLDDQENLRLVEVRTQRELEVLELSSAGLVYSSAHFKALAVGGGVSEAFALAGERACYNSLSSRGSQLLILGTSAVHMVKMRTWPERIFYLSDQGRWTEALNLAAEEGSGREGLTMQLLRKYLNGLNQNSVDKDSLTAAVNCCVKLGKRDILCEDLLEAVSTDSHNLEWYYALLSDHICAGTLKELAPTVSQMLVRYLADKDHQLLERVLLSLDIGCLDLHQALKLCKKLGLYNAWIHITTKTLGDYTSPLIEFLADLTPTNNRLGNTMLVYVSSCLAGLGYPTGNIPETEVARVKHDILRCLETVHSINGKADEPIYPYLRALLRYNIRECLNVIELAFTEDEFAGEMGLLQRQRLVQILSQVVAVPDFSEGEVIVLACFVARLVVQERLRIDDALLNVAIHRLTTTEAEGLNFRDQAEREQAWLDLLRAGKLVRIDSDRMLEMALASKCYRVAERLYELRRDYRHVLRCYVNDPTRKLEAFGYVASYVNVPERRVREQFFECFEDLARTSEENAAEIAIEHFSDSIEQLASILDGRGDLQYRFLSEVVAGDAKLPPPLAEKYLGQLCVRDSGAVYSYVQLGMCRTKEALQITEKYGVHRATALLLEQSGEWLEALELLINHEMIEEGAALCVRGAEHLDHESAQQLWLALLQSKRNVPNAYLRQLINAAAPHVPPDQLLDLVSDARFGDVRELLRGMLADYHRDVDLLKASLTIAGKDFHHKLAKMLHGNGKGLSVSNLTCGLCGKSLSHRREAETNGTVIGVWACGHSYHDSCLRSSETKDACPECHSRAVRWPEIRTRPGHRPTRAKTSLRPDLEGLF
ncbi:vacuolar protein sorting-associated protein 8 homolog isoform X1 [Cylas formicarius]|uniref:vacuolar protein sorting-associated protein 8 homolog isoform X1 n=1 Tax=Cylas formicarius TaxID=197179 RepID=UPI0029588681|nr:vacuolar protein sorting-associated protein 8 homolog isoform X1 [Cylas formicarius]